MLRAFARKHENSNVQACQRAAKSNKQFKKVAGAQKGLKRPNYCEKQKHEFIIETLERL